jgi:hypothetical protein
MRRLIALALLVALAATAPAQSLGPRAPVKSPQAYPENIPNPIRQGGETIETAFPIPSLPFSDTGTTAGYLDDYDEACPHGGNVAPDVVYRLDSAAPLSIEIDLCGSNYDTKVYIYDTAWHLIACNDDYYMDEPCGVYVSRIEQAALGAGTYYIVVDGYGQAYGSYDVLVQEYVECVIPCPADGVPEGEPPLVTYYFDYWNGGCNTDFAHGPFQVLAGDANGERTLCGVGGWYTLPDPPFTNPQRDTDWYTLTMGEVGAIDIVADAESSTYLFELLPQDCEAVAVVQSATAGDCLAASMTIDGYAPGQTVWFWVGSTRYDAPQGDLGEYSYVVWFSGLAPEVATEPTTWSAVKALYD